MAEGLKLRGLPFVALGEAFLMAPIRVPAWAVAANDDSGPKWSTEPLISSYRLTGGPVELGAPIYLVLRDER